MKIHPYAEKFPMIPDGPEWDRFKAGIRATKGNKLMPIIWRDGPNGPEILDGRNRLKACRELRIKPTWKKVRVKDHEVEAFIDRLNEHRRHLGAEERAAQAAKRRAEGASIRAIAGELHTSPSTVRRDLSGAPNGTPEIVLGLDGKNYSAMAPVETGDSFEGELLCPRCRRVGKVPHCSMCKQINEAQANRKKQALKNGQPVYSLKNFDEAWGRLYREIDALGKQYGQKETPRAEGLRRVLAEWKGQFKEWHKELQKAKGK